ncbi:MAG: HD domain-containing protein [Actinomycetota bacterium]|nr:HD domain-containing protein [Actinomycetota bacterium]
MPSRAGKGLLAEEREVVLSRALESTTGVAMAWATDMGVDARETMKALLDAVTARDEGELQRARQRLVEAASELSRHGLSWKEIGAIPHSIVASLCEQLGGRSGAGELSIVVGGLLRAQAILFEAHLEAEERRREKLSRQLREVDSFPDTIAATLDPTTLTKVGLARLKEITHMAHATRWEFSAPGQLVPLVGDLVREGAEPPQLELNGVTAFTLLEKMEPYWESRGDAKPSLEEVMSLSGAACMVLLPMVVRGRTTGIISLADNSRRGKLASEEVELAVRFSNRLAVALENAYLHEREQRKIKETVALLEIARAINSTLDLSQILDKVVQMTVGLCDVVMCAIYLREDDAGRFEPAARYGFIEESRLDGGAAAGFHIGSIRDGQLEALEGGDPVFLPAAEAGCLLPADLLYEHGVDTVFLLPLRSKEKLSGVFTLFYPCREPSELEVEEIEVVKAITAQASMAIENAALYEDIEKSYFSTVRALAKAIEVKDPYTHGHSERVTEYALMIADAMRLEERERQKLKYAATLHDIGKIGIAGRVLNKAGGLTSEEYTHVKTHPVLGESIVEPVEFLQGPRPIILHHHERYDGTGYPQGLKGEAIPLCARILSVADAFEAMRSDRPYRRALNLPDAVEELRRNSGSQFDPRVVEVFLDIIDDHGGDPIKR